ncbi:unnamed protein product [Mycena citricolor]|uniref:Uncharacterized protein n=1 Tax=Mycena citricolor TaxID=2018698 RepID=A0AAD2JWC9_9AGAR|nr:unnamed protein product [Mycena citricolor]
MAVHARLEIKVHRSHFPLSEKSSHEVVEINGAKEQRNFLLPMRSAPMNNDKAEVEANLDRKASSVIARGMVTTAHAMCRLQQLIVLMKEQTDILTRMDNFQASGTLNQFRKYLKQAIAPESLS